MKHICRNCHFLAKAHRAENGEVHIFAWNENDRKTGSVKELYSPNCYHGVWDAGIDPSLSDRFNDLLDENRRNFCFFIETHPGMSFQAAKVLQERRAENAQLKRSNLYTQIGLWIAALALIANALIKLFK